MDNIIVALAAFLGSFAAVYLVSSRIGAPQPASEDRPRSRRSAVAAIMVFATVALLLFYLMSTGAMAASLGMIALATTFFLTIVTSRVLR